MNMQIHLIRRRYDAFTTTEMLVAATLLVVGLVAVTPALRGVRQLANASSDRNIAITEASNQLERLTLLDGERLQEATAALQPSAAASENLPELALTAQVFAAQGAERVVVTVTWETRLRMRESLSMVGWSVPRSDDSLRRSDEEEAP